MVGCPNKSGDDIIAGGLVAKMVSGEIHSSMAIPEMLIGASSSGPVGGLVGSSSSGDIRNSFVNGKFTINSSNVKAAGLLGKANGARMLNCYVFVYNELTSSPVYEGIVNEVSGSNDIDYCYVEEGYALTGSNSKNFTATASSDKLGYMYSDNIIENDTTLMGRLNLNAMRMNKTAHDSIYSHWSRPGLAEINGDLPVLLLNEFDVFATVGGVTKRLCHQGNFRSVGTYAGGHALQYGGPVRDNNELQSALTREKAGTDPDCLFVYGDVNSVGSGFTVTQGKVSYQEDVAILDPGQLTDYANNYVGISFDNSFKQATATPNINYGLYGIGGFLLPRDWHMFSSPLSNAPMGFDYKGDNVSSSTNVNNPWEDGPDFTWLGENARYWMYGWENSLSQMDPNATVNTSTWVDGYFPSQTTTFGSGCIAGFDEEGRFPYGMDFYTWNEPQYHWINFKRNGPNHWHSDEPHVQLNYVTEMSTNHPSPETNVNESMLISSKGYMAAISSETFMQSHGKLNAIDQKIKLTNTTSSKLPGWNLVGNPYHGYLDFDKVGASDGPNKDVLSERNGSAFYVVYNADKYANQDASTAFRYYPVGGSDGGDYADRYLHPHQGFYVKAKDGGGDLKFNESMLFTRQTLTDSLEQSHFRNWSPVYPLVNLYLSSDHGCADVTVIEFDRPEWGGARKMKELRCGNGVFYAQHDNTHYAALFTKIGTERVPLWFEAKEDDIYTIKWNTANGDFHSMYLIDNKAGIQYDMLRNNSYTFEGHTDDYPSRFYIVFDVTDVEEHTENHNFVFFDGSQWMVTGEGQLEFIDLNGQILWKKQIHGGQTRVGVPEVASGMYLFRLTNGKETKVQKIIVNRF